MDINNDLQQINTFVKGMNTDVSDALMDSSQYRYAENVRITTNKNENTGDLRIIEGNSRYSYDGGEIKAMTSIRNLLIVITKEDKIYCKDTNDYSAGWRLVYKPADGDDSFGDHLSLVTRWESYNNVKLYIADGIHPLMYINIMDKDDNGDYIIVEGIDFIKNTINTFLDLPTAEVTSTYGNLNAAKIQYAYRLYKLGGATTTISPLSEEVVLYKSDNRGYETFGSDTNKIPRSVTITIPENTTDCEYLLIFRIAYVSYESIPQVAIVYDALYKQRYVDSGYDVTTLSYADFLSLLNFNITPTVIESKQDYLFSGNISDEQTEIDNLFKDLDARATSSGDYSGSLLLPYNALFDDLSLYDDTYWRMPDDNLTLGGKGQFLSWQYTDNYVWIDNTNKKYRDIYESATTELIRSLRPGEIYRYGVVLYDDKGNHTSAKWIADIMIPETGYGVITEQHNYNSYYKFKQIGITFNIDWDAIHNVVPNCKAIEIVRCIRTGNDRLTITLGIAGYPLRIYDKESDTVISKPVLCSPGIISTNRFAVTGHMRYDENNVVLDNKEVTQSQVGISDNNYLLFASPEYVYLKDDILNIINSSSNIYIETNGIAKTPSSDDGYLIGTTVGDDEFERIQKLGVKRIGTLEKAYDHGVPYSVWRAPENINDMYEHLYNNYISSGNGRPTYYEYSTGIFTFMHSAWIAHHFAQKAIDWDYNEYPYYPGFVNKNAEDVPKVYTSVSEFKVESILNKNTTNITNKGYADVPRYDSLFDETTFRASDDVSIVGSQQYINWTIPIAFENDRNAENAFERGLIDFRTQDGDASDNYENFQTIYGQYTYPIGSTGECIILEQENASSFTDDKDWICANIVSIKHNVQPYNGVSTIDTSTYSSFGNIIPEGTSNKDIYDGDCFPGVFIYNACHSWFEGGFGGGVAQSNVQMIPLYSDIDLSATFGDLFPYITEPSKYWFLDTPVTIESYSLDKYAYLYNTMYGIDPTGIQYVAIKYTKIDTSVYDTRIFHSNVKTNNEHIDSWLKFSSSNYIDIDSRFGSLTNMRLFKDKLLFWQEYATGVLGVNERTVLNDTDEHEIIVGSGGVLSRYDYISTVYGMKPYQYDAEVQSNYTQYWWDGHNKEILAYTGGMELIPLTKTKSVTNYINLREESIHPMLAYDTKYDEILAQVVDDALQGETLVYNELIQAFSSVYKFMPWYKANIKNTLYLANDYAIYEHNKADDDNYAKLFDNAIFPKVKIVVNKNSIYTKTFDTITFGGRMYKGSLVPELNTHMLRINADYIHNIDHINVPMHHIMFSFTTPLKQSSSVSGDKAVSVDEYDYRLSIPRNGQNVTLLFAPTGSDIYNTNTDVLYGNRMRGKTMQCEITSDYNSTDFSLQYITTKFRMSWS